jgi:hypothetical protein
MARYCSAALAAAVSVFALQTGIATAAGEVTVKYKVFPDGTELQPKQVIHGSVTETAKNPIPGSKKGVSFVFLFWDVDGTLNTNTKMSDTPTGKGNFATAWYLKEKKGGGDCGTSCAVATWAFSLTDDKVMTGVTPIASVSPSGLWTSPSTSVSTVTSSAMVTITSRSSISPPYPAAKFQSWQELPNTAVSGSSLSVSAKTDAEAIAFYKSPPHRPIPQPCPPPDNPHMKCPY